MIDRRYKWKVITIAVLCVAILAGLLVLHFTDRSSAAAVQASATPEVTMTPAPTPVPSATPVPTETPTPEPTVQADLSTDTSITRYISQTHTISSDYVPPDLVDVDVHSASTQQLREEAAEKLKEMFQAAIEDQVYLKLVSGYRSYTLQNDLYHYYISIRGHEFADNIDDHPGASEHQLGLAADLGCWNGACELQYCFTQYGDYTWLQENSYLYGWIERYPEGKQEITGIMYSPWHFRYVGAEEAKKIHDSGLTMEEYYGITD